jgi:hypothetical protein
MEKGRALQAMERRPLCSRKYGIGFLELFAYDDGDQCKDNKQYTENDRNPEEGLFNAATGREDTTGISAG